MLVGSLGRLPVGALTDKYGAKLMFPPVSALTIVPVLLIPAKNSYGAMIAVGFLLGLGGTTFAIGVPLVNSWFPPARRGFALGMLGMGMGMGMGGVALAGCVTRTDGCGTSGAAGEVSPSRSHPGRPDPNPNPNPEPHPDPG